MKYPPWLAPYALALLGFNSAAVELGSRQQAPEVASLLSERHGGAPRRTIVIVSAEPSPLAIPDWTVSPSYGALAVSRSRLSALANALAVSGALFHAERPWLLMEGVESETPLPPENLLDPSLPELWHKVFPPSRRAQLFAREPPKANVFSAAAQALRTPPRYVVGPRNIEEAVSKTDHTEPTA
jgi:hypothetical protein